MTWWQLGPQSPSTLLVTHYAVLAISLRKVLTDFVLCLNLRSELRFIFCVKTESSASASSYLADSPTRADSPLSSTFSVLASSPENSLSSFFPPSSRHWIYEESPDRKVLNDDEDDEHIVRAFFLLWKIIKGACENFLSHSELAANEHPLCFPPPYPFSTRRSQMSSDSSDPEEESEENIKDVDQIPNMEEEKH